MIATDLPPAAILILGGLIVPLLPPTARRVWLLALPVLGLVHVLLLPEGSFLPVGFLDQTLTLLRVDRLSRLFGIIFMIAAFLGALYAFHLDDRLQQAAATIYAGSAIGALFAGDLVTLFVFWELTAISSVFLIWAAGTRRAYGAGMRYLIVQVGSGVLLLAGVILHVNDTGSIAFDALGLGGPGTVLIFLGFGIKCAFPLLHNWLQDAYPEATVTGTVYLSAFTTKLAVYALARGYAGTEMLIWIGAVMAVFPIFYAVIENDLRRVLAYSLNNQLGFMVVGIGIGTEMALNGAAAHAFNHILYEGLLFMSMGAVLYRTGTAQASELGGLYKSMPWTTGFCIVGAASISAFPLLNGFVSKSLILETAAHEGHYAAWLMLLFASAGALHYCGIKVPYFAFFGQDSGRRCEEAPGGMRLAMGLTAALCVGIGVWPGALYALLPYPVAYEPYTAAHVLTQLQLLLFSALAFAVLMRAGVYPSMLRSTHLDFDWVYRRAGRSVALAIARAIGLVQQRLGEAVRGRLAALAGALARHHGPQGILARTWPTGSMALWAVAMLGAYLFLYYI